ncbi:hypothetical protein PS706_02428 [Pseudomonas fluorescens]|jgi:phosphoglycerate dehydrogenase-like enzyme|nr:hypothetical protein RU03_24920 [Pseudomonas simiae]VVN97531.1 hypothetical protein PS706_02428 [Pseudomonas fluorescens]
MSPVSQIARGGLLNHEALRDGHPLYTHPSVRLSPRTSAISTNSRNEIWSGMRRAPNRRISPTPNAVKI